MDRTPGGGPNDSIHHYDFSAEEIEVAATLTNLNFLIPLYDFRNFGFLPPLWGSKRLRSACAPDRQRTESVVATDCPVISCGGNLRNISPDSPLLLKASPTSGGGAQGCPGIVVEPPREKEVTKKHGCKDDVDDSTGTKTSKNNPQKEKTERRNVKKGRTESEELPVRTIPGQPHGQLSVSQVTRDPSSTSNPLPNGGAHASPSSPLRASGPMLLFDLNLTPPDCSGIQSPLPDEDGTPGLPPSVVEVEVNGSNKAEATGAARLKRFRDMEGEIPQGCCIGHQGEPRFHQMKEASPGDSLYDGPNDRPPGPFQNKNPERTTDAFALGARLDEAEQSKSVAVDPLPPRPSVKATKCAGQLG